MLFNEQKKKLSRREWEQAVARLEKIVRESVSPFEHDTAAKKEARIRRAREDQDFFDRTYLPHYFTQDSPPFHAEMEEMEDEGERQARPVAIAAPRGFSKSTRITFARRLKRGLYKEKKFIVVIGNDNTLATEVTVSQRIEFEVNPRIVHDFGKQQTSDWAQGDFVIANGTRYWARGTHQRIRGEKHGPYRPDDIVLDDPEDDEMVANPDRIKKFVKWVREAVYPSLEPKVGLLSWVGTLLSTRSALAMILKDPAWLTGMFRAIDNPVWDEEKKEFTGGISLWPARFPLSELSRIRRVIGSLAFNKEYQNDPRDDEAKVKDAWIKRMRYDVIDALRPIFFQALDPSLGENETSDFQAHSTVGIDRDAKLYLRYADIKRRSIDSMVKTTYLLHSRFNALAVGLETIGFQKLLRRDFDREAKNQGRFLPIVPINHHGLPKLPRVLRLTPLMENGVFLFAEGPPAEVGDIETWIEQMLFIEQQSVHDDGPDSGEMAATLAERMGGLKGAGEPRVRRL